MSYTDHVYRRVAAFVFAQEIRISIPPFNRQNINCGDDSRYIILLSQRKETHALFADLFHARSVRDTRFLCRARCSLICPCGIRSWNKLNHDYLDVNAVIDILVSLKTSSTILLTIGQSILSAAVPRRGIANLSTPCSWQCFLNCIKQARIDEGVAWSHQFSLVICQAKNNLTVSDQYTHGRRSLMF